MHAPESPMINTLITCSASGRGLAADEADIRTVREDDNDKTGGGPELRWRARSYRWHARIAHRKGSQGARKVW